MLNILSIALRTHLDRRGVLAEGFLEGSTKSLAEHPPKLASSSMAMVIFSDDGIALVWTWAWASKGFSSFGFSVCWAGF